MSEDRKLVNKYKSISWLLIASILLVAFLPAHYHLHHLYNDNTFSSSSAVTTHAHVIDLHVLTDNTGQLHHDDEATSIAATPDGIVKNSNPDLSPFILLTVLLLLLPGLSKRINILLYHRGTDLKNRHPYFTPLLRAPPLL